MSEVEAGTVGREPALIDSEERFRLLIEGTRDYAIYMLDLDGTIVSWNSGAERIKGYSHVEAVGQHFSIFYTPEDREAGKPEHDLAQARAEGRVDEEGWRVRKDGIRFWAASCSRPSTTARGSSPATAR